MVRTILVGALVMWVLTPSGAVAWPTHAGGCVTAELWNEGADAPPAQVSPYVDPATGAILTLSRQRSGTITLSAIAGDLEVTKRVTPAGTFDLRLSTAGDLVRVVASKNRLTVSRGKQRAVLDADLVDDLTMQRLQVVLAGSGAVRQFRQVYASMSDASRKRPEGAALGIVGALLGWLQGDVDAIRRARPARAEKGTPRLVAIHARDAQEPSCYEVWAAEVVEAWDDYEGCVYSFEWWNPAREVCAFLWVIRAESAWFTMIGCSAIPMKLEAP